MDRRLFLQTAALAAAAPRAFELEEITITDIQAGLRSGRFTVESLTRKYLDRIKELDKTGPAVNAVIELNPDAMAIAKALDREKTVRGPLHGVPVLIKDNIDTHDRMRTSAGSLALAESIAPRDAFLVERLRAAGAVILGKTNLSEWANFRSTHSVSGWSGRGGQTRLPYALDRNPSGSSSGSGVAVACNMCAVAVGTETDGSVISPSAMNSLVGIKPTLGLVSRSGIVPIAHSQDTAGPMARTVRDAAILLGAMAGVDPLDAATKDSAGQPTDYTQGLDAKGLRGARLGVARKFFGRSEQVDKIVEDALAAMRREGAAIVDPADLPSHGTYREPENDVLQYEFKADLNTYLAGLDPSVQVRSLASVIAFNEKHRDREMPVFGQEILLQAEQRGPLTDKAYLDAVSNSRRLTREEGIDAVIQQHRVDAIVAPTSGPAWLTDWVHGDRGVPDCTAPAAIAGYPHITVPVGFVHGLPIGISFFGARWSEPVLIRIAYAFEQMAKGRRGPRFLATVQF
jgi:amidase